MGKHKAGLHKKISSIFDGVPLPKTEATPPPAPRAMPVYTPPPAPKPAAPKPIVPPPAPNVLSQPPTMPAPAPVIAPPAPAPRPEPSVAPIKQYNLDSGGAVEAQTLWSKLQALVQDKLLAPKEGVDRKRQIVSMAAIPLLIIVLIIALPRALKTPGPKTPPQTPDAKPNVVPASAINWNTPEPYAEGLRDPTKKLASIAALQDQAEFGELRLAAITVSDDKRIAAIGDRMVREQDQLRVNTGDSTMTFVIVRIDKDVVEYESAGVRYLQKVGAKMELKTPGVVN